MSNGAVRNVSQQDIQVVQNLIERCLQLYMNQKEVVETLLVQARIEPGFTELVWQKLEEQNREFFRAYYLRLTVKHQIMEFNRLLEQQVQLMRQMHSTGVAPIPTSNGSIPQLSQNSAHYSTEQTKAAVKTENIPHAIGSALPNSFADGPAALHTNMHIEMSAHSSRNGASRNVLSAQSSNMSGVQGINGAMIKTEADYSGTSPYIFGAEGSILETRPAIADASITPFNSVESSSQGLGEQLMEPDNSSFGFLGQIPRNFSLSDLTADFSQSILESYSRSPFLATDNDNFLDAGEKVDHQGDNKRLDTISEGGLSYEDFGSE